MMAFPSFDTTTATWQRRTLRYLGIYLTLALTLVAARYFTQGIRPELREMQKQEASLQTQRDDLEVRVQAASSPQRVQEWAVANGFQRFAESSKTTRDLGAGSTVPHIKNSSASPAAIEVKTQWK